MALLDFLIFAIPVILLVVTFYLVQSGKKWYCPHCLAPNPNKAEVCQACGVGEKSESEGKWRLDQRSWQYNSFFATYFSRVGVDEIMGVVSKRSTDDEISQAIGQHLRNVPEDVKEKNEKLIKGFTGYVEKGSYSYLRSFFREEGM